jgi:NAD(P)-dependent dehydrogenase (short-subunit alcohol dehydrogenase family)
MATNDAMVAWLEKNPTIAANALPVPLIEPIDISNALLWLVSDDARYVTGITLPVDAGFINRA